MLKNLPLYIKLPLISGSVFYVLSTAFSQIASFTSRLDDYIDANTESKIESTKVTEQPQKNGELDYLKGDWKSIIINPRYQYLLDPSKTQRPMQDDEFKILSYGSMNLNLSYGKSINTVNRLPTLPSICN